MSSAGGSDDTFTARSPAPGPRAAMTTTTAALPPSALPAQGTALAANRRSINGLEQRPTSRRVTLPRRGSAPPGGAGTGSREAGGREAAAGAGVGGEVDDFLGEVLEECPFLSPPAPAAAAAAQEVRCSTESLAPLVGLCQGH